MKIVLVRRVKPDFTYKPNYTALQFNEAMIQYNQAHVLVSNYGNSTEGGYGFYCSSAISTQETSRLIFGERKLVVCDELNEVPLRVPETLTGERTFAQWRKQAIKLWRANDKTCTETYEQTYKRVWDFIDYLEKQDKDSVVISHELVLKLYLKVLKKRKYEISRGTFFGFPYGDRMVATNVVDRCGGCARNCLLVHAKCAVGYNRAVARNIKVGSTKYRHRF